MNERRELPLASRRILVVDDQPSIRGVLEVALTEAGADVWTAANGAEALEAVGSGRPDLILLDLIMPEMNGWQVIDALKSSPRTSGIPVVLQTSMEDFASFERAKKGGLSAFISKPFRLTEVVEICRRIFEGARPLQGKQAPTKEGIPVQIRDAQGNLLTVGSLLDLSPGGAQVDLETPLRPSQAVTLTLEGQDGYSERPAEVRWVRQSGSTFHHGLLLP